MKLNSLIDHTVLRQDTSLSDVTRVCNEAIQYGFAEKGATVEAVKLLREHLPHQIQIKASGGIRTYAFAQALVDAGASRLGSNSSEDIILDPLNLEKK